MPSVLFSISLIEVSNRKAYISSRFVLSVLGLYYPFSLTKLCKQFVLNSGGACIFSGEGTKFCTRLSKYFLVNISTGD